MRRGMRGARSPGRANKMSRKEEPMKSRLSMVLGLISLTLLLSGAGVAAREPAHAGTGPQAAIGSAFTYQGHLNDGGAPANGTYDFTFQLYDVEAGGSPIGTPDTVTVSNQMVVDGIFTV